MTKRLCDLVSLIHNDSACVVLEVKESTQPLDLIKLGFNGDETMFRMTKSKDNTSITIFREGEKPFSMNMGSGGTTIVPENLRIARSLICECVHLDFGIVTHEAYGNRFKEAVEATVGPRDLDSHRYFELQRAPSYCSLWVNQSHIANIPHQDIDEYMADRNIRLNIEYTREAGLVPVDIGTMERVVKPEQVLDEVGKILMVIENYKGLCEHNFLVTEAWLHENGFAKESRAYMSKGIDSLKEWGGFYLGPNITYDVKKCDSTEELNRFMNGEFNDHSQSENKDWYWDFQQDRCSPQALETLADLPFASRPDFAHEPLSSFMQEAKEKAEERNRDRLGSFVPGKDGRKQDPER